jgi:hypothetical protein
VTNPLTRLKNWLVPSHKAESEVLKKEVRALVHDERNKATIVLSQQAQTRKTLDGVIVTARRAVATLERARRHRERHQPEENHL